MNNPRIGSLVQFGEYPYYGVVVNKIGLIVASAVLGGDLIDEIIYKVLVEEVIYEAYTEEFEPL